MELRRLAGPIVLGMLASTIAFTLFTFYITKQLDEAALTNERTTVELLVNRRLKLLQELVLDSAWWDETYERVTLENSEDQQWLSDTFADFTPDQEIRQQTLILDPTGRVVFAQQMQDMPTPDDIEAQGIFALAKSLFATDIDVPINNSGLYKDGDSVMFYAMSTILPANGDDYIDSFRAGRQSVMIYLSKLTRDDWSSFGSSGRVTDLAFDPASSEGLLPLSAFDGRAIGSLSWQVEEPGTDLLKRAALPALVFLLILIFLMTIFGMRAFKMVKDLRSADETKSNFLASMSHEIRTPLNAILGFTQMLSAGYYGKIPGEKNREYIQLIHRSGEHLLSIINDMLDISKLEAGEYFFETETLEIKQIILEALTLLAGKAYDARLTLKEEVLDCSFDVDKRIVKQIVLNLVSNAIKFTPEGGTITVSGDRDKDRYVITVADTGKGMTAPEVEMALSLFGQVRDGATTAHEGAGLGLPIVDRLVKVHNGSLAIVSQPGEGTVITVSLPLKNAS